MDKKIHLVLVHLFVYTTSFPKARAATGQAHQKTSEGNIVPLTLTIGVLPILHNESSLYSQDTSKVF